MNWGHKIAIFIGLFILTMLTMVFVAFQQTNEVIETEYYQKELKYQNVLDACSNLNQVDKNNILTQTKDTLIVTLPATTYENISSGKVEFLRNSDMKYDKTFALAPDATGKIYMATAGMKQGQYQMRCSWQNDQKQYYREETIFVQ